jgi:sugar (pentulose or hexulose) kinase
MKTLAAILLGGALIAAPALAQDNGASPRDDMAKKAEMHHAAPRHERYKRNYKTDQEEHQATEDLNKQYRGVNAADVH